MRASQGTAPKLPVPLNGSSPPVPALHFLLPVIRVLQAQGSVGTPRRWWAPVGAFPGQIACSGTPSLRPLSALANPRAEGVPSSLQSSRCPRAQMEVRRQ